MFGGESYATHWITHITSRNIQNQIAIKNDEHGKTRCTLPQNTTKFKLIDFLCLPSLMLVFNVEIVGLFFGSFFSFFFLGAVFFFCSSPPISSSSSSHHNSFCVKFFGWFLFNQRFSVSHTLDILACMRWIWVCLYKYSIVITNEFNLMVFRIFGCSNLH